MNYRPQKSNAGWFGLIGVLIIFGFIVWGIYYALGDSDRTLKLMLLIPSYLFLAFYAHLIWGAFNLQYRVEDDALVIVWGLIKQRISWTQIEDIIAVQGQANFYPFLGASWPGYVIGMYSAGGLGAVRMFATQTQAGFICLNTPKRLYGITPAYPGFLQLLLEKTGKTLKTVDMDKLTPEQKGESIDQDRTFKLYRSLNQIFLFIFALYLGIFFPGSGAPKFVILLLVLALALYFFNVSNARRMYQFSPKGANITLLVNLMMIIAFICLAFYGITFQ